MQAMQVVTVCQEHSVIYYFVITMFNFDDQDLSSSEHCTSLPKWLSMYWRPLKKENYLSSFKIYYSLMMKFQYNCEAYKYFIL